MKLRITRPDGTVVEVEGTAEECARFAPPLDVVTPRYDGLPIRFTWPASPSIAPTQPWWDGTVIT